MESWRAAQGRSCSQASGLLGPVVGGLGVYMRKPGQGVGVVWKDLLYPLSPGVGEEEMISIPKLICSNFMIL